ncbi:hypothetical protein CCACVL1_11432, partial [Corchorus capsularis]
NEHGMWVAHGSYFKTEKLHVKREKKTLGEKRKVRPIAGVEKKG